MEDNRLINRWLCSVTAVFLLSQTVLYAQINSNASIYMPILNVGVGARAAGMGSAYVALADDSTAIFWNSAGLAQIKEIEITFAHNSWLQDTNSEYIAYTHPFAAYGTLGVAVSYLGYGTFESRDMYGALQTGKMSSYDLGANVAYGIGPLAGFLIGGAVKLYRQTVFEESSSVIALDIGGIYHLEETVSLGINVRNVGIPFSTSNMNFDMPLSFSIGVAFRSEFAQDKGFIVEIDTDMRRKNFDRFNIGMEYKITGTTDLRLGYIIKGFNNDLDGLTGLSVGLGFLYKGMKMDYAFSANGDLGSSHRLSLTMRIGEGIGKDKSSESSQQNIIQDDEQDGNGNISVESAPIPLDNSDYSRQKLKEGKALQTEGDWLGAFNALYESVHLDANNTEAWQELGNVYQQNDMTDEAAECYEASLQLDPTNEVLRKWLADYKEQTTVLPIW